MLSTSNVAERAVAPKGAETTKAGGTASAETGEFDFLSYLLGLESQPGSQIVDDGSQALGESSQSSSLERKGTESDRAWMSLFLSQGTAPVSNPMVSNERFPTGGSENGNSANHALLGGLSSYSQDQAKWLQAGTDTQKPSAQTVTARYAPASGSDEVGRVNVTAQSSQSGLQVASVEPKSSEGELGLSDAEKRRMFEKSADAVLAPAGGSNGSLKTADVVGTQAVNHEGGVRLAAQTVPEVFQRVEALMHQGGGSMTVRLSPPDLGQVQIHVTARGKRVEIEMLSDNAAAKSALESSLADLKNSIQSQDLVLSKMEVHVSHEATPFLGDNSFSTHGGSQSFQQSTPQGQHETLRERPSFLEPKLNSNSVLAKPSAVASPVTRELGRVNMRI